MTTGRDAALLARMARHGEEPANRPVLQVEGLTKVVRDPLTQRRRTVLHGIDLEVGAGEVFGLLGVNGAGKTTTLQCVVGLTRPSGGRIRACGGDPLDRETRGHIGFLPERPDYYDHLHAIELLDLVGRLHGLEGGRRRRRTAELLELLRLERVARAPLGKLSKGERQRLGIAQSILHDPELVVFDEPMSGLDPIGRRDVRDLVEGLRRRQRTVIFSSHVVPDVEVLCDRVGIVHEGRLIRVGRIDEITSVRLHDVDVVVRNVPRELLARLIGPEDEIESAGRATRVRMRDPVRVDPLVVRVLQVGGTLVGLERRRERLEDYLVRTTSGRAGTAVGEPATGDGMEPPGAPRWAGRVSPGHPPADREEAGL
ncbi:MAG: ABC transporter ATP-binding protein [Candidatus Eiseniibacteriota bacterium]|jgi:ABC-2 type transport system ATP-binding protein